MTDDPRAEEPRPGDEPRDEFEIKPPQDGFPDEGDEDWELLDDGDLSGLELALENDALETDLRLRGAEFGFAEDVDPALRNAFLHQVMMFEDQAAEEEGSAIRDLFPPDFEFTPAAELDDATLQERLDRIAEVLGRHGIVLGFGADVPARLIYEHLLREELDEPVMFRDPPPGFTWVLDGCSGACEECFQRCYCASARDGA